MFGGVFGVGVESDCCGVNPFFRTVILRRHYAPFTSTYTPGDTGDRLDIIPPIAAIAFEIHLTNTPIYSAKIPELSRLIQRC